MSEHQAPEGTFDIAVIGYGPTGLAMAYWLGSAGHKTVVIERWPDLYSLPRAGHVDGEVMRLFQKMGVGATIAADSSITTHTLVRDSNGDPLMTIPGEGCDQGWSAHYSLYQPNLERTLDAQVRSTGNVTVLQGWQAESITGGDDSPVHIEIASGTADGPNWIPSGQTGHITAKWLIGADGANSAVSKFMGASIEDLGFRARALVIFAERLEPTVGSDMPDTEVGAMPSRPYVALRESGKRFARWEFLVFPNETTAQMSEAATAWELIARWGFTPQNSRLVRHTVFEFCTLVADTWRKDNVLIAGDAAHRMPPHAGQGMCSGQRDAAALAWRLDLVLRGVADSALLDSYTPERRPHVLALTQNSMERAEKFWLTDPVRALERDERLRQGLAGRNVGSTYGTVPVLTEGVLRTTADGPAVPAGHLSPQFTVTSAGTERLLDDLATSQWVLIATHGADLASLDDSDKDFLDRLNTWAWSLDEPGEPIDSSHSYRTWLEGLGVTAVLVRPDSYIFGCAKDGEDLKRLVAELKAKLHARQPEVSM